jgi:hypothetical protein
MEVIAFLMREPLCLTCKAHHRGLRLDKKISAKPLGFVLAMDVNVSFSDFP